MKKLLIMPVMAMLIFVMLLSGCGTVNPPAPTAPPATDTPTNSPAPTATAIVSVVRVVKLSDPQGTLRVHKTPDTNGELVTTIANGAKVTVLKTQGDWIQIQTNSGSTGYILLSYTVADTAPTPTPGATFKPGVPTPAPGSSAYGIPAESAAAPMSYFDDALIVGDSVSYGFKLFVDKQRLTDSTYMGTSIFLAGGDFGINHAITPIATAGSVHPTYQGDKWLIEDLMAAKGYKKVYIMLGMNDIALYGIDKSVSNYAELISRIRAKNANAMIYIESVTPTTKDGAKAKLNNTNIYAFNDKMHAWCIANQCYFLDIASVLKDSEGNLPKNLSNDNFVHLETTAFPLWVDYLRKHTK